MAMDPRAMGIEKILFVTDPSKINEALEKHKDKHDRMIIFIYIMDSKERKEAIIEMYKRAGMIG